MRCPFKLWVELLICLESMDSASDSLRSICWLAGESLLPASSPVQYMSPGRWSCGSDKVASLLSSSSCSNFLRGKCKWIFYNKKYSGFPPWIPTSTIMNIFVKDTYSITYYNAGIPLLRQLLHYFGFSSIYKIYNVYMIKPVLRAAGGVPMVVLGALFADS